MRIRNRIRCAHGKCVDNLFIPKKAFWCSKIRRQLGKNGEELYRAYSGTPMETCEPPIPQFKRCLVCGEEQTDGDTNVFKCNNKCKYFAHSTCIKVHATVLDEDIYSRSEFKCDMIIYQIKPDEVEDNEELDWDKLVDLSRILKMRGKVNTSKYSNKRKRW